jgi:hypothetical protein
MAQPTLPDPHVAREAALAIGSIAAIYRQLEDALGMLSESPSGDVSSCTLMEVEGIRKLAAEAQRSEEALDRAIKVSNGRVAAHQRARIDELLSEVRHHRNAAAHCLSSSAFRNQQGPTNVEVIPPDGEKASLVEPSAGTRIASSQSSLRKD